MFRLFQRVIMSMSLEQLSSGAIFLISTESPLRNGEVGIEATHCAWKGNWILSSR
jgi:hypothetical protein